jgi:hypothetical protein
MNKDFYDKLKGSLKTAKAILTFCSKHRAEFLENGKDGYMVFVAKKLATEVEEELRSLVANGKTIAFKEAPKLQTQTQVQSLISRAHPDAAMVKPDLDQRTLFISMDGVEESHPVWGQLTEALKKDGFFESWKLVANGHETRVIASTVDDLAKNTAGKDKAISEDDVTNLKISLGSAQTVDDILKAIGG